MKAVKLAVDVDRLRGLIERFRDATAARDRLYTRMDAACRRADVLLDEAASYAYTRKWEARSGTLGGRRDKAERALGRAVVLASGAIPPRFGGFDGADEYEVPPVVLRVGGTLVVLEWFEFMTGGAFPSAEARMRIKLVDAAEVRTL